MINHKRNRRGLFVAIDLYEEICTSGPAQTRKYTKQKWPHKNAVKLS